MTGDHRCTLEKSHGPIHLCSCGVTWSTKDTSAAAEAANEGLTLNLVLSEKDLNSLYIIVDQNERAQATFITKLVTAGKLTPTRGWVAVENARDTTQRVKAQIAEQYPLVPARAEQIRSSVMDFLS